LQSADLAQKSKKTYGPTKRAKVVKYMR
jgi:hypothetical protein